MSDYIKTEKVLDLLAGVVAEIIKMPPEHTEEHTETHSCVHKHTEMHGDTVSREDALEAIRNLQTYKLGAGDDMLLVDIADVQTGLMMMPSADEPSQVARDIATIIENERDMRILPKMGRWIHIRTEPDGNALYECSECHKGEVHVPIVEVRYCWNCGARMVGGEF